MKGLRWWIIVEASFSRRLARANFLTFYPISAYEYVADSEEASASQAESYTKSEDEAEFIERTQAFIANMQKLRAEFQDEEIKEEEVEMTEEYNEEVVQMADVKWAIPQKAPVFEAVSKIPISNCSLYK